jgi:hypothetical protein
MRRNLMSGALYERADKTWRNKSKVVKGGSRDKAYHRNRIGTTLHKTSAYLGFRLCRKRYK